MKRADSKEKSSVFYIGKWVIILSVILTSSLSFILGFFVGKSYSPSLQNQISAISQQESNAPKNRETEKTEPFVQQQQTQEFRKTGELPKPQEPQQAQQTKETKETKEAAKTQENSKTRKYTVQAGAFKNAADADSLKTKLEKKGYKASVISSKTKKHETIHKVMIGEFPSRKDAELLSIKIKKAEGLRTFVTFKP